MRPLFWLLLGLGLFLGWMVFDGFLFKHGPGYDLETIPVPRFDIPEGTKLDAEMFVIKSMVGGRSRCINCIRFVKQLEGKVARRTLTANIPVTSRDLAMKNYVRMPVSNQDIPAGTAIDAKRMFKPDWFDPATIPANTMSFTALEGRIAARRLAAGKLVTESDLIEPAVQAQLLPGYRAVAMRARCDDPAFAKSLQVGTRVDVRVTVPYVDKPTSIVMRGILVLAVQLEKDTDIVKITLMVTPDQAKSLLLAPSSETPKLLPHRPEPATKED